MDSTTLIFLPSGYNPETAPASLTRRATPSMPTDTRFLHVDVPPDVAREAADIADRENIAIEDALVRLTYYDYPPHVVREAGVAADCSGP